jgi:hypothetical protein
VYQLDFIGPGCGDRARSVTSGRVHDPPRTLTALVEPLPECPDVVWIAEIGSLGMERPRGSFACLPRDTDDAVATREEGIDDRAAERPVSAANER